VACSAARCRHPQPTEYIEHVMVPARTRSPLATVSPSTTPTQLHVVPAARYLLAQTLVSSEFRVPVIPVGSAAEVVAFIKTMHEQEQHSTPRTTWKPLPDRRQYDEMVGACERLATRPCL
jgi:hypothetical protein